MLGKKFLRWKCDKKNLEKILYFEKNLESKMKYEWFGENFCARGNISNMKMQYKWLGENFILEKKFLNQKCDISKLFGENFIFGKNFLLWKCDIKHGQKILYLRKKFLVKIWYKRLFIENFTFVKNFLR